VPIAVEEKDRGNRIEEPGSGSVGEPGGWVDGMTGGREDGMKRMSLRGIARSKATQQSEAIHIGIASTIIPANDNDHCSIQGGVLLEAILIIS